MIPKVKYYGPRIPSTYAVNMTAATSGSNGITVADDDDIDFGTGDFFIHWEGSLPDWNTGSNQRLWLKYQDANNYVSMFVGTSGALNLVAVAGGVTVINQGTVPVSVETVLSGGQSAKITITCSRETASAAGTIAYYINGSTFGTDTLAATATVSISNTGVGNISCSGSSGNGRLDSNTISCIVGNFAPTASEVLDLCTNGIPASWKWGSQASVVSGDNSSFATVGNWTGVGATVTGGYNSGDAGHATCLRIISAAGGSDRAQLAQTYSQRVAGKRYRVKFSYKTVLASSGYVHWFRLGEGANAAFTFPQSATWVENYAVIVTAVDNTNPVRIYNSSTSVTIGDEVLIDNLEITPLGATMAILPDTIPTSSATTWSDTSGNTGGGTLPASGATKVTIRR